MIKTIAMIFCYFITFVQEMQRRIIMEEPQLTWEHERLLFVNGLNTRNWLLVSEDDKYLVVKYKFTDCIKKIKKG